MTSLRSSLVISPHGRGVDGAAVTLTASSESSRAILADARPQLVAEAKAQGKRVLVDVAPERRQALVA